ncbi:hypothetical protein MLD38_007069 [Melastoma candidum]|uniref:Uncharacterized protein n=1 Tax=Melastoma candidum TaxID=119954 RepID=A0ACB9RP55_9MYRT|nr:hypothetical protein MLD38_007069 [Melastoma candidum]
MNNWQELSSERGEMNPRKKPKAVIVGGSIAGVSCAHALMLAGWEVVVLEKSHRPPEGSPTGAGLGLNVLSLDIVGSWLGQPEALLSITKPMVSDQNQAVEGRKIVRTLTSDETFNHRSAHWSDLHHLLYRALPPEIFLWGHLFLSFSVSDEKESVSVEAKLLQSDKTIKVVGDLLVAADGCFSSIRQVFYPDLKLRYSGYCAWRGVFEFSGMEDSEIIRNVREAYPKLGKSLYLGLVPGSHNVLFEIPNKRLNWIWYVNQPEPKVQSNSSTMKVTDEMVRELLQEAETVWPSQFVSIMKATKTPFLNIIYDCDPVKQLHWDNVVLIGDAAHPVTPHCSRSTNMSVLDAAVLGKCLKKWGRENLQSALEEYQSIRLPVAAEQVLYSRRVGRIKQGLMLPDRSILDPAKATPEECWELQQSTVPFFGHNPLQAYN